MPVLRSETSAVVMAKAWQDREHRGRRSPGWMWRASAQRPRRCASHQRCKIGQLPESTIKGNENPRDEVYCALDGARCVERALRAGRFGLTHCPRWSQRAHTDYAAGVQASGDDRITSFFVTGADSPLSSDSSASVSPSRTIPSAGIRSPALTRNAIPGSRASMETNRSPPSTGREPFSASACTSSQWIERRFLWRRAR